jgi:hypothetical protein
LAGQVVVTDAGGQREQAQRDARGEPGDGSERRGVGFCNCFGQSEIGPLPTVLRPEEHAERPDSVGRAVLFVETRVVDEGMRDVAPRESGEVVYRSPQLCRPARSPRWAASERSVRAARPVAIELVRGAVEDEGSMATTHSTPA